MLVYIENKDKNWADVDAWLKQQRKRDGTITPDVALEALKMTNLDGNLYYVLKEINKFDECKRLEYKDFVVSAVQGREHGNKVYSALQTLAEEGGYIDEFEKADSDVKIYNSKLTKGVVLDDFEKLKEGLGKDYVIVANISNSHTTCFDTLDLDNVVELNFVKDCRCALFSSFVPNGNNFAKNLPKKMNFSGCSSVYFCSCDMSGVESIVLQEGGEVRFNDSTNLPENLDLSGCKRLYLNNCNLAEIKDLSVDNAELILFSEAYNFPKDLDLSNCSELYFRGNDFKKLDNLRFKDGAEVWVDKADNLTKKFDVSNLSLLNISNSSFENYDRMVFMEGSRIEIAQCSNLPNIMDFSRCENGYISSCDMRGVEELIFKNNKQRRSFLYQLHQTNYFIDDVKITLLEEEALRKRLRDRYSKE